MAYATYQDVQERMTRTLSEKEQAICSTRLEDAAVIIDAYNADAPENVKLTVSCNMMLRLFSVEPDASIPIGATQGAMGGLGYSQSWTISGGSNGEVYLSKLDKKLLKVGNKIGSYSPVQELVCKREGLCDEGYDGSISC